MKSIRVTRSVGGGSLQYVDGCLATALCLVADARVALAMAKDWKLNRELDRSYNLIGKRIDTKRRKTPIEKIRDRDDSALSPTQKAK